MSEDIPDDLVPLPMLPFDKRPLSLPLDVEECRTALWLSEGNVTKAANMLKCSSQRLRSFVKKSEYLQRELDEAAERIVDAAVDVMADALRDPDRADAMARFVLGSTRGKERGWGNGAQSGSVAINNKGGNIVIQWGDGTPVNQPTTENNVIEGTVEKSE